MPLERSGKAGPKRGPASQETCRTRDETPSGAMARRTTVNTAAIAGSHTRSGIGAAIAAAFMGLAIIVITGHVQAGTLHDAAHDVRHATGFPCH